MSSTRSELIAVLCLAQHKSLFENDSFSIPFELRSSGTDFEADRLKVTHCGPFIIIYDLFFSLQSVALWAVLAMYVGDNFFFVMARKIQRHKATTRAQRSHSSSIFRANFSPLSSTSAWNYEITTQAKAKSRLYWGPLANNRRFKSDYITFVNFRSRWHFTRINKTRNVAYSKSIISLTPSHFNIGKILARL